MHGRRKDGVLPIPDRAAPGAAWEIRQDPLTGERERPVAALIVTTAALRTLAAVPIPAAAVRLVTVRPTLTAAGGLLLPAAVFPVEEGFPAVPEAVFPVPAEAADRVPDKWQIKPDSCI